jgi:hypothetical protein
MAWLGRVGAREQGHEIGAGGVRDPGFLSGDAPLIAVANRARADGGKVGTGVGLGEHGRRYGLAARQSRQPARLLGVGA